MILYISGPMRGYRGFNFEAFRVEAKYLRRAGHDVLSPVERDEANGFDPTGLTGWESMSSLGFNLREALAQDAAMICESDGVVVLDGWEHSKGARAEVALAEALGLPILKRTGSGTLVAAI